MCVPENEVVSYMYSRSAYNSNHMQEGVYTLVCAGAFPRNSRMVNSVTVYEGNLTRWRRTHPLGNSDLTVRDTEGACYGLVTWTVSMGPP